MKKLSLLLALSLALVASSGSAFADDFTFTATGANFQSTGTITANVDSSNPNLFDVTAISGEVNNVAIDGLVPCASGTCNQVYGGMQFTFDDVFFATAPALDINGILFNIGSAAYQGNFYFQSGSYQFIDTNLVNTTLDSFSIAPEPSTFVFLGTGLLGMVGLVRRRFGSVAS